MLKPSATSAAQLLPNVDMPMDIPRDALRQTPLPWPTRSELDVVRGFTQLSQKNLCVETATYPLGSCTMKYNPRVIHDAVSLPGFLNRHPLRDEADSQSYLGILYTLQIYLARIIGMNAVSLTPMAGAQGEFAGVSMIKAYHDAREDYARTEMLIPDAAHGTNPASACMAGFTVVEIPTEKDGTISLDILRSKVGPHTAGIMLTNPSTIGLFMDQMVDISGIIHEAGGLLYYDGANLNAILGRVRPGDMGFDVMHVNTHKTFATPHGGGGPGAGPIGVSARLKPYLPLATVIQDASGQYRFSTRSDTPKSIGRLSCFMGNAQVLLRAYFYILLLGEAGLLRVSEFATLNANYLLAALTKIGFTAAYPGRRASHEFILTLAPEKKAYGITAMDVAKRLLDFGVYAPTTYFPLLVPECLLIEPTETESKAALDEYIAAMKTIREEMIHTPDILKEAPHRLGTRRLDDVYAARHLDLGDNYSSLPNPLPQAGEGV